MLTSLALEHLIEGVVAALVVSVGVGSFLGGGSRGGHREFLHLGVEARISRSLHTSKGEGRERCPKQGESKRVRKRVPTGLAGGSPSDESSPSSFSTGGRGVARPVSFGAAVARGASATGRVLCASF